MDPGYRTALIDLFRRGEADRSVRLVAAQGLLAPRAHEQVALLMMLLDDTDPEIATRAETTIAALPTAPLAAFLARADVPEAMRTFFAPRGMLPAPEASSEAAQPLLDPQGDAPDDAGADGAHVVLSTLPVVERMKLAFKGTREQRAQLIRDSNRIVATAVLSSPKLNESEVEAFAKMANVSEDVLRIIGTNRTWLKNYAVARGLARNPKTPPALSMQLLHRLGEQDVKVVSADRNLPELVRQAAKRLLSKSQR